MAPLLRASFHGLRCSRLVPSLSLSSQREILKPPESSYTLRRWYGESAALEEACSSTQTVNDTAGEIRAVVEDFPKPIDGHKSLEEILTTNSAKEESSAKKPSSTPTSDKLTNLILGKLRSKNSPNDPRDNGVPFQAESKANKVPEGASSQKIGDDKFNQVLNSMRNMVAKKSGSLNSGGARHNLAKTEEGEIQDDFSVLVVPQGRGEAVHSKISSNSDSFSRPAMNALRNFTPKAKSKEGEFQGLNAKQKFNGFQNHEQKAKEVKPVSFNFLKSFEASASTTGVADIESSEDDSVGGLHAKLRSSLLALGDIKPPDSVKPVQAKNESPHEVKSASSHEAKNIPFHEVKRSFIDEQERIANEVTSVINRTTYPGYTVCIRNLPSQSNLALVKEALSFHGEVISSFKKSNPDGSCNAFVEFKTAEAMDGALASRWLSLDSKAFSIVRTDAPITTVVRLSTVGAETSDSQLVSVCEKFGFVDHIKRRGNGFYDVYYRANELSSMSAILDSLNEVTLNQRRLVALPAPLLHPAMKKEVLKRSEGQAWQASQLSQTLHRIEMGLGAMSVWFDDLKSLTAMEDEFMK